MHSEPREGAGWERATHGRVMPGAPGATEFDYADGLPGHRGGYEVARRPPPRHTVR